MQSKRDIGQQYESLAANYLRQHGCRVIAKNYHCPRGEIDLVVRHNSSVVFVEVKYRKSKYFGPAVAMVTPSKQRKIIHTAQIFLQQNKKLSLLDARFDVVGITNRADGKPDYEWIQGAFTT
ncbi:MAG: YraN family protein [Gammaproteobacteria bacterium]